MSCPNWNGGKAKGRAQARAWLMHDDTGERPERNHANADIDTSLTYQNRELGPTADMTFKEKSVRLDARLDALGYKEGRGKNRRVSMQAVCIYPPKGLLRIDKESGLWEPTIKLYQWFHRADALWREAVGDENCMGASVHFDEQHWYREKGSTEMKLSLPHLHECAVPVVKDLDGNEKISGKQFSSRARIIAFNDALENMTQEEFGMGYLEGKGAREGGNRTVEDLKADSASVERAAEDAESYKAEAKKLLEHAERTAGEADRKMSRVVSREKSVEDRERIVASAEDTRRRAREEAKRTEAKADEIYDQAADALEDAMAMSDKLHEEADSYARRTRKKADDDADAIRAAAEEEVEKAREEAIKAAETETARVRAEAEAYARKTRDDADDVKAKAGDLHDAATAELKAAVGMRDENAGSPWKSLVEGLAVAATWLDERGLNSASRAARLLAELVTKHLDAREFDERARNYRVGRLLDARDRVRETGEAYDAKSAEFDAAAREYEAGIKDAGRDGSRQAGE